MRAFTYRFLQRLFSEPDKDFYEFLAGHSKELDAIGIQLGSVDLESLQVEYTRLFLGPQGHLPPYESVFSEGRFWGDSAVEVKRFAESIGLELTEDHTMPPDHISIEFEILEKILASGHPDAEKLYGDFFSQRIKWVANFLQKIIPRTKVEFYRTSFEFAGAFLKSEEKNLPAVRRKK